MNTSTLIATAALAATIAASGPALANPHPHDASSLSLGLAVGDPTAIDLKIWTGGNSGIDLGFGFNRFSERLGFYLEYELGLADFWLGDDVKSIFYLGVGGAASLRHKNDDTSLALIIPIGLNFRFRAPVEIFVEARPGLALLDKSGFGIGGQVGVRYVF